MERDKAEPHTRPERQRSGKKRDTKKRGEGTAPGPLPELLRRAAAMGFSGLFTTEEAIRKALGDTLPQDWVDFAALQSDRARAEFLDRMISELGRVLENVDLADVLDHLLDGRTVEINAQISFGERSGSRRSDTVRRQPSLKLAINDKTTRPKTPRGRTPRSKGKA